jgi:hypothetical protein
VDISKVAKETLPRRNGYRPINSAEILTELRYFGIGRIHQLRRLLQKHRKALVSYDRDSLTDRVYLAAMRDMHGDAEITSIIRFQRSFSWEALIRTALEMEFGARYDEFSRRRDGL